MNVWVFVGAILFLCLVERFLVARFSMRTLRYDRALQKNRVFEGDQTELTETLINPSVLFIPWLRTESRLSRHILFVRQENLSITGEQYHKSIFTLLPFQKIRRRHKITLSHRGVFEMGNVTLTAGDLLFDSVAEKEMRFPLRMTVYPRLVDDSELARFFSQARDFGRSQAPRKLSTDPFLIRGIRPYVYGDAPRDIHWRATAKTDSLQVRVHEPSAENHFMILLNGQMRPDQWGDLMPYEQADIEYGISLAASFMLDVLHHGGSVGFASNMTFSDGRPYACFLPLSGEGQTEFVLESMADLRVHQERSILHCVEDLSGVLHDMDILLLSVYQDEELDKRMDELRKGNRSVLQYMLPHKEGGA